MPEAGWILVKHFIVLIKSNPLFPVYCANIAPSSGRSEGPESLFGVLVWLTVQFKLFWLGGWGGKAQLACERMETKAVKKENSTRRALIRPKSQIKWRFTGKKNLGSSESKDHLSSAVYLAQRLQRIQRKTQVQSYQNAVCLSFFSGIFWTAPRSNQAAFIVSSVKITKGWFGIKKKRIYNKMIQKKYS